MATKVGIHDFLAETAKAWMAGLCGTTTMLIGE